MIFNCFLTDNLPEYVLRDHQRCAKYLNIDVNYRVVPATENYDAIYSAHGNFINELMTDASPDEVICFMDIDALPWSKTILAESYRWVKKNRSFIGNAQNISHTRLRNDIYAAASMLMISKSCYLELGQPDMAWTINSLGDQIDTAQNLTRAANDAGFKYRLLYPIGFDDHDKKYDLGGFGSYGTGTLYPGTWHYFRISSLVNSPVEPKIWEKRVSEIMSDIKIAPEYDSQFFISRRQTLIDKLSRFRRFFK